MIAEVKAAMLRGCGKPGRPDALGGSAPRSYAAE